MPNVLVNFTPPDESSWSFTPQTVPMKNKGTITLERESGDWVFVRVTGLPSDWKVEIKSKGKKLIITDPLKPSVVAYAYTVTVADDSGEYTSPLHSVPKETGVPPIIINDGSLAKKRKRRR